MRTMLVGCLLVISCRADHPRPQAPGGAGMSAIPQAPTRQPIPGDPVPEGPALDHVALMQFAVYGLPGSAGQEHAVFQELRAADHGWIALGQDLQQQEPPFVVLQEVPVQRFPPPGPDAVSKFGEGLTVEQAALVQAAPRVVVATFFFTADDRLRGHRAALELMASVAERSGGLLWDEETRQMFSVARWRDLRLAHWAGDLPDVAAQISVRSYEQQGKVRLVTMGLIKFAVPDLVMTEVEPGSAEQSSELLRRVAQNLLEGSAVGAGGQLVVPGTDGTSVTVRLAIAHKRATDPDNRLWQVSIAGGESP